MAFDGFLTLTTDAVKLYMHPSGASFSQRLVAGGNFSPSMLTEDKLEVGASWRCAARASNTLKQADSVIKPTGVEV